MNFFWLCECVFIAIIGLCGIQCKCSYGAIVTMTLNPTIPITVVDSGFPRRGRLPPSLGQKPIIWQDFCRKLREIKRNWIERGHASLAPPLGSVNVLVSMKKIAVAITPCEQSFNAIFYSWNIFKIKRVLRTQHAKVWKGFSYPELAAHYGNWVRYRNPIIVFDLLKLFRNHDA